MTIRTLAFRKGVPTKLTSYLCTLIGSWVAVVGALFTVLDLRNKTNVLQKFLRTDVVLHGPTADGYLSDALPRWRRWLRGFRGLGSRETDRRAERYADRQVSAVEAGAKDREEYLRGRIADYLEPSWLLKLSVTLVLLGGACVAGGAIFAAH